MTRGHDHNPDPTPTPRGSALTVLDLVKMVDAEEAKWGERLTGYLPATNSK